MPNVDDRVVSIQFDNAAFERNVAGTIATLDKLKASLDFANAKNNFAELNTASRGFNLDTVSSAVDGISAKFIALSTIAITTLANITNRAVDAGIRIAKSLSLDQAISGFQEYETNMNSIQTILANTSADGSTLKDVTAALDELNRYSDQTIYNFSEMARNIGTFTAAGVDLDTATGAIKGIANLAAISGSNSQQASSAMYQLSQALASGTLKLMDWNSVVNAGMGGEVFQKALFESGKAMQTIKGVSMDTTFEEWTAAGNSFRASLESGWITADVLTNTLAGFTGDLTEAQIMAMGYTQAQAAEIMRMGELGKEAATKVKTFTQLIGTVKEAIGSGWSKSFQLIVGDFEEAKGLFSYISESIGSMVGQSADARNVMLGKWKAVGGRTKLLLGLKDAVTGIGDVLKPIAEAFRDIFPPMTAVRLVQITDKFAELAARIQISGETAVKLHQFFRGLFAIIDIGWEVLKGLGGAFADIVQHFVGTGDGLLNVGAKFGRFFTDLHDQLVNGGGIADFFDNIPGIVINFVEKLKTVLAPLGDFKDRVAEVIDYFLGGFSGEFTNEGEGILLFANKLGTAVGDLKDKIFGAGDNPTGGLADGLGRVTDRLDTLKAPVKTVTSVIGKMIEKFKLAVQPIENFISAIGDQLSGVWDAIADAMDTGEFDKVLDLVNTGLLGGIVALLMKFVNDGIGIDIGDGFISKMGEALDGLTGTMEAMQTKLKSEALLNIGKAIALIVASVVVLSLIDSEALTKGMSALAVGFGQLIGAMALLSKISSGPTKNASLSVLAAGLVIMAGAILILAGATALLATLDWNEMVRGITGVAALLVVMVAASKLLEGNEGGLISAGAGMILMAGAINIMAIAVKIFGDMSWDEILKGLTGVAGGLAAMTAAAILLPDDMMSKGLGIVFIAGAMILLAEAMKMMSGLSWEEIGKGLVGVAGGLAIMVLAMRKMPKGSMLKTAASLLILAGALDLMAAAIIAVSFLSWEEIAKGLTGLAGAMIILAAAAYAMDGALPGALAIAVMSVSLILLAKAMKTIGKLKLTEIGKALLGLAGVFVVLGLAGLALSPLVPPLLALGVALLMAGAGLILFGAGALLVANAVLILAKAGKAGVDVLMAVLDALLSRLPDMAIQLALGLIAFVQTIGDNAPMLIDALVGIISSLIDGIITLAPKLAQLLMMLIDIGVQAINEKAPDIIECGFNLLMAFLTAIRDNIGQIVTVSADIIIAFLQGITEKLPDIITAAVDLLVAFLNGITDNLDRAITAGTELIVALIQGISNQMNQVVAAGAALVVTFLGQIAASTLQIVMAGTQMIIAIIRGIGASMSMIVDAGVDTLIAFLQGLGSNAIEITNAAFDVVVDFINGLAIAIRENSEDLRNAGKNLAKAILEGLTFGLIDGTPDISRGVTNMAKTAISAGNTTLQINSPSKVFRRMGEGVVEGFALGISNDAAAAKSVTAMGNKVMSTLETTLATIPTSLAGINEFNPVIAPVLDLTGVQQDAKAISGFFNVGAVTPAVSYDTAKLISTTEESLRAQNDVPVTDPQPASVTFEQNIYSPDALSVNDIYRATRSQIQQAKLELSIP